MDLYTLSHICVLWYTNEPSRNTYRLRSNNPSDSPSAHNIPVVSYFHDDYATLHTIKYCKTRGGGRYINKYFSLVTFTSSLWRCSNDSTNLLCILLLFFNCDLVFSTPLKKSSFWMKFNILYRYTNR